MRHDLQSQFVQHNDATLYTNGAIRVIIKLCCIEGVSPYAQRWAARHTVNGTRDTDIQMLVARYL